MKFKYIFVCFLLFFSTSAFSQKKEGYKLIWEDEFNGNSLDTLSWSYDVGDNGWGNNELQNYTFGNNVVIENGILKIIAKKENGKYTSSRIITKNKRKFTYGLIEIRAKVPAGKGSWPALWMLGENITEVAWPKCGEIDIMEHVGKNPGFVHTSIHNASGYGVTPYTKYKKIKKLFEDYHIYGIDWSKDKIVFLIDGKKIYTYAPKQKDKKTWPFDKDFFIIFNLAVGGNWGGPAVDDSIFPLSFDIDYIKVYQKQ